MKLRSLLFLALAALLLALGGCTKTQALVEPKLSFDQEKSLELIEQAIARSLTQYSWVIVSRQPGEILARYSRDHKHPVQADIKIIYNSKEIQVLHQSSEGLLYEEKGEVKLIHRNFNRWMRNLEKTLFLRINNQDLN